MNLKEHLLPEEILEHLAVVCVDELVRVSRVTRHYASNRELRFALLPEYLPTLLPADLQDPLKTLYSRLYWFNRFLSGFARRGGFDAGLEDQASDILGHAPPDVDWQVAETVIEMAKAGPFE